MSVLDRAKLFDLAGKYEVKEVKINGDDIVFVKELNGTERDAYEASLLSQTGKDFVADMENARAKLLVKTVCDAKGTRLFKDTDVNAVGQLPAKLVELLFSESQDLNKITDDDVEEAVKN